MLYGMSQGLGLGLWLGGPQHSGCVYSGWPVKIGKQRVKRVRQVRKRRPARRRK